MSLRRIVLMLLVVCACGSALVYADDWISGVNFAGKTDDQGNLVGRVGDHFEARIRYDIGWFKSRKGGGPIEVTKSAVTQPEFLIFGTSLPDGLTFNSETGVLSGTPRQAGTWRLRPAVRDAVIGIPSYSGSGFWRTQEQQFNGKTWMASKYEAVLEISR